MDEDNSQALKQCIMKRSCKSTPTNGGRLVKIWVSKSNELDDIESRPKLHHTAPFSYLDTMLSEWQQWALDNNRGSKNFDTMADLKTAAARPGKSCKGTVE